MIGIVIFNLCCFAYSIFEISQTRDSLSSSVRFFYSPDDVNALISTLTGLLIAVVAIIGVSQCIVTWLAYQLFQEFGWKIYKKIGADPNTKSMTTVFIFFLDEGSAGPLWCFQLEEARKRRGDLTLLFFSF